MLVNTPPASPVVGASYIVGTSPTGAWAGHAEMLAGFGEGGWRFLAATEGLTVFDKTSGQSAVFVGGAWDLGAVRAQALSVNGDQVVGARLGPVADPAGGATIDAEARSAVAAILSRLRQHGLIDS